MLKLAPGNLILFLITTALFINFIFLHSAESVFSHFSLNYFILYTNCTFILVLNVYHKQKDNATYITQ
jgi:hypothetical protein